MVSVLTSMVDPLRFPGEEIVDLYSQRWEIELGYRAIKQRLLGGEYTLRSKTPEMIAQELWGVLLGYNLLRYQMVLMSRLCSIRRESSEYPHRRLQARLKAPSPSVALPRSTTGR